MAQPTELWIYFNIFILAALALDLGLFHKQARALSFREAVLWTTLWVMLAAAFALLLGHFSGRHKALEFATGYVIEGSLSADNLFVFLLIFQFFQVPPELEHRVLFWGILGALVTRGAFVAAGVSLLERFGWITFLFGGFLVYSGLRMLRGWAQTFKPEKNPALKLFRKFLPVSEQYEGSRFIVNRDGRRWATPLLLVLLLIETTDIVFATDSIPAVLAITPDPFIVYSSNVFAIIGLRSLYFALAHLLRAFRFLHYGIAAVLVFIGAKMLFSRYRPIETEVALGVVAGIVAIAIIASLAFPKSEQAQVARR
jgi:tellurite resistance protein TerC